MNVQKYDNSGKLKYDHRYAKIKNLQQKMKEVKVIKNPC